MPTKKKALTESPITHTVSVQVPVDALQVAAMQRSAEADLETVRAAVTKITTPDQYAAGDALLTDVVRKKDAAIKMRQSVVAPAKTIAKTVEGWFRPLVLAYEVQETHLKDALAAYRLAEHTKELAARERAAVAAEKNRPAALFKALEATATHAAAGETGRASVSLVWEVETITEAELPREYFVIDVERIRQVARAHKEDSPPTIPGVTFKRGARVGARR